MDDHNWKIENELSCSLIRSIFHFPFSIRYLSSVPQGNVLRKRALASKINPVVFIAILAAVISISSFLYFFAHDMTNVYGDGVAHVNIARKVVDSPDDSLWRRYIQIGSPWLPLQTVLMLPLVTNDWMWRTGAAGSIVSMISFIIAALSLYLLARNFYRKEDMPWRSFLPALSAAIFLFNPSVLYMQSTPMGELVFMASLVGAVYLLQRWVCEQSTKRLAIAAGAMTVATLARYEAWPVAALSVLVVALISSGAWVKKIKNSAVFSVIVASGPCYWLWHNWAIYGDALEFLTGPNSARGIYLQNRINFGWSTMFIGHAGLDVLVMGAATAVCAGPFVLLLSVAGLTVSLIARRKALLEHLPLVLLILPFFFHAFSVYRGEIQVFPLSAFGLLNIRYGLPHVLGVALFAPAAVLAFKGSARRWAGMIICLIVAAQYWLLISDGPTQLAVYQEGYRNGVNARPARDRARVASFLIENPPGRLILMHTGALGPVVSEGGLRFSEIVHEGSLRWHQLDDGIAGDIATVIVQKGDPLDVRIRETPALARDIEAQFEEKLSVGNIKMLARKRKLKIDN